MEARGVGFNGREPDENRYDIDLDRLDSYSGRLWMLPNDRWALQVSAGRLVDAEPGRNGEPPRSITRPTTSATYHRPLANGGIWASTAAWGQNIEKDETTNAYLVETNLNLAQRNIFFARAERTEKSGETLVLDDAALSDRVFVVSTAGAGYVRQFGPFGSLVPALGLRASVSLVPRDLEPFYGSRSPAGVAILASVRPRPMEMAGMGGMKQGQPMRQHRQLAP